MLQIVFISLTTLALIALLAATTISWVYWQNPKLNPIRFYLIQNVVYTIILFLLPNNDIDRHIHNWLFNTITFMDLCVLSYYFWSISQQKKTRIAMFISFIIIISIHFYFWTHPIQGFSTFMPTLYGLDNLFMIIPCLLFLYELFQSEEITDLKTNPHLFIACALLFFYGTTFPFFLTYKKFYIVTPEILSILNSILNTLLIFKDLTILKAFLCRYQEAK